MSRIKGKSLVLFASLVFAVASFWPGFPKIFAVEPTILSQFPEASPSTELEFLKQPKKMPDLSFVLEGGQKIKLSQYRGKVILIHFWSPTQGTVDEITALDRLQAAFKPNGFEVMTIALNHDNPDELKNAMGSNATRNLKNFVNERKEDLTDNPVTFLIDRSGQVVAAIKGETDWRKPKNINLIRKYLDGK